MKLKYLLLRLHSFFSRPTKAVVCGHATKQTGEISAFGRTGIMKLPRNEDGSIDHCLSCISNMAIRCSWCGESIFIGDPITLYTPKKEIEIPEYAVMYQEVPFLQLVGCLRFDCANTGADRAGFWVPGKDGKGRVHRIPTIFEMMLASEDPSPIIIQDLTDMGEAKKLTERMHK